MAIVLAFGAQAQGTTYAVRLSDNSGAYEASLRGDQEKLLEISQTSAGGLEVIAKALYLRSLYRLDESSRTVSECGALSQISRSTANWSCAMILAGNKLSKEWCQGQFSGARIFPDTFSTSARFPMRIWRPGTQPQYGTGD
jgi:hypothetical protein